MRNSNSLQLLDTSARSGLGVNISEPEDPDSTGKQNVENSFYNSLCLNSGNVGGFMRESRNGESEILNVSGNQTKIIDSKERMGNFDSRSEGEKLDPKVVNLICIF